MDIADFYPHTDFLIGLTVGLFLIGFIIGVILVGQTINTDNPYLNTTDTGENKTDYSELTCELAKYQTNATYYYNESSKTCVMPDTNQSVNQSE